MRKKSKIQKIYLQQIDGLQLHPSIHNIVEDVNKSLILKLAEELDVNRGTLPREALRETALEGDVALSIKRGSKGLNYVVRRVQIEPERGQVDSLVQNRVLGGGLVELLLYLLQAVLLLECLVVVHVLFRVGSVD